MVYPTNVAKLLLNFGDYVQLQMDNNPTNTMCPRHIDCIALQPTGTTQGMYYFMDLHMGKQRHGCQWTKCAMTEGIISQVEVLGLAQKRPNMHNGPIVTWRNGDPIAPIVVPDVDAYVAKDGSVALAQPLFFPLDFDAIVDIDVAPVAPLRVHPAYVGAENAQGVADQRAAGQGAAGQGVLALADEEIEGVAYEVIESDNEDNDLPVLRHYESDDNSDNDSDNDDSDDDDNDNSEAKATEAPRHNLRR